MKRKMTLTMFIAILIAEVILGGDGCWKLGALGLGAL